MKKLLSLCLLISLGVAGLAQETYTQRQLRYHDYRLYVTEPAFHLAKMKKIIKNLPWGEADDKALSDKAFNALSFDEKFTYVLIHGEANAQNCDAMPRIDDEDHRIFAYPPGAFGEDTTWSDRQEAFAKKNRGEFIKRIRALIRKGPRVGINLKYVAKELNGYELIPDLVAAYRRTPKDLDILSTLMVLMVQGKYQPFLASQSFKKLYAEDANYKASLIANEANRQLICDRAMAFYKSWKK